MKLQIFSRYEPDMQQAGMPEASSSVQAFAQITAAQNGLPVASLCLYENPYITYHSAATMLFGNLKLPEDNAGACLALFRHAGEEARKAGKQYLLGPINGSTWHEYRLPLQRNAPMFSGDSAAPASWTDALQTAGYSPADIYHSSLAVIGKQSTLHIPEGILIRPITPDSLTEDLRTLYPLCMKAFAQSPYFSPVPEEVFITQHETLRPLLGAHLSHIALRKEAPVAFTLAYPDLLHPERKTVVVKTLARHPEVHIAGLIKSVGDTLYHTAWRKGYTHAIHAFMHESNRSVQRSDEFGGNLLRSYALFVKNLCADG